MEPHLLSCVDWRWWMRWGWSIQSRAAFSACLRLELRMEVERQDYLEFRLFSASGVGKKKRHPRCMHS